MALPHRHRRDYCAYILHSSDVRWRGWNVPCDTGDDCHANLLAMLPLQNAHAQKRFVLNFQRALESTLKYYVIGRL